MILIVDDKPENIFSLKKLLELNGFEVDAALSGEEALKKILKSKYALIILDVQMPGMDGFEVAEAISGYSKTKDVPVIFLSAVNTEKKFVTKGYFSGALDYITKPVDPDILLLKVKTFHRLYEQKQELTRIHQVLREEIEFRKKAQSELRERVQELRSILETIPQIAFTAKNTGEIEFVNQHWFNYSNSGHLFPENHPDENSIDEKWAEAIQTGQPLESEVNIKKLNQDIYRVHLLRAIPVKEGDNVIKWVGTFTDIEDQKQAENKKIEFLSIASHELKTPLTSIKAYFQILERSLNDTENKEVSKKYLNRTQFQLDKLQSLIADLLDISKIESGKIKFNKKTFELEPLLNNAIEIINQTHDDYKIIKKGTANVKVYGDDIRIEQVIINYLTNAIKYSPEKKEVHVEISTPDKNEVKVLVKDFGIGIPKEKQSNIFQKFYRVEESSHRFQGLGMGLYICSDIIRRHNGKYGVKSTPGEGSEFYFSLPIQHTESE
ncbi:ATP-binding protein [Rubrolithibacter danxiaensis]|uniref:ATP-binding response regulator n=1 Tax=Rubrolithibacter danxiaensis TaxID=3390805 RepID=UPI003BF7AB2C